MFSLWPQLVCAAAEQLLCQLLAADADAVKKLNKLNGKQLAVHLKELKSRFVLTVNDGRISINQHHEPVDCAISSDFNSLTLLSDTSQLTKLIKEDRLSIDGDIQVAQQFSYLMQQWDPDWHGALSRYLPDALAYKVVTSIKTCHQLIQVKSEQLQQASTEFVQDELSLSPLNAEVQLFSHQVSQLSRRVDSLIQQFRQLQE